ncbi:putative response regulatory protein [Paenibacillus konkukensis]|uniref:Response regulatory protein n=1 Tax=Paenibacillus konkukensis TaxID=2020716 RepID=A0ABY4RUZ0_9BACL|nr:response regulator [Paenibacillus konkukensis]UQZ86043.1 putative response regulatory protein [Paenibacillus konkukensis]
MKAIIVDDEKHVREAVKLLVDWNHFGIDTILEAQDGEEAIEMIGEHRPQIIFTDMMMPTKNGLELLEWLEAHYAYGKTIVISGHDDFQLVRHTVKHGGVDYILKPIDAEQLHAAVGKAVDCWIREENERHRKVQSNIEMNQIRPVYWEKTLSNLVAEPSAYEASAASLDEAFGIERGMKECRLAIIAFDTMSAGLKAKFDANSDLLFFSVTNICNEILRAGRHGVAYRYWNSDGEILILLYGASPDPDPVLADIQRGLTAALRSSLDIGVSLVQPFPYGLPAAYREAQSALRRRNLRVKEKRIYYAAGQPSAQQPLLSYSDYAEQIRLAVKSGSEEQIGKAVDLWLDAVRALDTVTVEQFRHWQSEYNVLRSRWLAEWFGERQAELNIRAAPGFVSLPLDQDGALSPQLWRRQLIDDLTALAKLQLEHQHRDNNAIFEIAKYIQNHYHQDITLQEIANHFYLSREYISRKFKQEFKVNLSDYLSDIRVEKAKLLLLNPHLRIAQIAEMVGYDDEKYFSKVFKKLVGLSPNEYRKVNQP